MQKAVPLAVPPLPPVPPSPPVPTEFRGGMFNAPHGLHQVPLPPVIVPGYQDCHIWETQEDPYEDVTWTAPIAHTASGAQQKPAGSRRRAWCLCGTV